MHNLIAIAVAVLLFTSCSDPACAFHPVHRHWTELAHESEVVGIIRIQALEPGTDDRPLLLQVKLLKLFKGEYSSKDYSLDRLFLDLTGKLDPRVTLDAQGKNLGLGFRPGKLYLAYMSPAKMKTYNRQRVMTLSGWADMALRPINHNILGYDDGRESGSMLRHTYNFLNALDRFCEIDPLAGEERKIALRLVERQLKRYPDSYLDDAFKRLSVPPKTVPTPTS